MYFFSGFIQLEFLRKHAVFFLAFLSVVGFSFGIYAASISAPTVSSLMRIAAGGNVSIVQVAVIVLLPFSFAAAAVLLNKPFLLYLLLFAKSFGYAFCVFGISVCFEQAGWLICFLLLFSDSFIIACLVWFALRHACSFDERSLYEVLVLACCCFGIGIVDVTVVLPVLSAVFNR